MAGKTQDQNVHSNPQLLLLPDSDLTVPVRAKIAVFTLVTRGRFFDAGVKIQHGGIFDVRPENDRASPKVKTPTMSIQISGVGI